MPSGGTHDRITLWGLPLVAGMTFGYTQSGNLTLLVSGGFLFGGLMFGPDLDIYSRQYKRWGFLRWIWLPYQQGLRHRSVLSHGPIIGTTLRILYFGSWVIVVGGVGVAIARVIGNIPWDGSAVVQTIKASLRQNTQEWFALFVGLELGAMSHSLSDWTGSAYKRFQKQGVAGLLPRAKMKKRKATTRRRPRTKGAKVKKKS